MDAQANLENDDRSFSEVMNEFESPLLRYATRILRDPDAAQDVVQTTFIKLHKMWSESKLAPRELSGWLYRVTHNNAVDYIRKESRIRKLHQKQAEHLTIVTSERHSLTKKERMDLVLREINKLKEPDRQVLLLRLQEGLSYREISEATDRSEGNIGCILHHAVKQLSARLKQEGALDDL